MNANIEGMFTMLLIGCAVGATLVAILMSGKPKETIVVMPGPSGNDGGASAAGSWPWPLWESLS